MVKKRITTEEYNKLSDNDKKRFTEMHFDEQFKGGDDIDYSYRVSQAGFKGMICDFWVQHHQLTDRSGPGHDPKHLKKMGRLFRKKWKLN